MKSMSGCFSALGGWLARHHLKPCCSVSANAFSCNTGLEASRISHSSSGAQQLRDLTWTEICTGLWYFSPTLYQQKRGQTSETAGAGSLAIEASLGNWPCPSPDLTCAYTRLFHLRQRATEAETELSASAATRVRVRGGQRSCRWAHESAGSPRRGQCGEGGAWHQRAPIMPFHSQDTRLCKALFQHCNLD